MPCHNIDRSVLVRSAQTSPLQQCKHDHQLERRGQDKYAMNRQFTHRHLTRKHLSSTQKCWWYKQKSWEWWTENKAKMSLGNYLSSDSDMLKFQYRFLAVSLDLCSWGSWWDISCEAHRCCQSVVFMNFIYFHCFLNTHTVGYPRNRDVGQVLKYDYVDLHWLQCNPFFSTLMTAASDWKNQSHTGCISLQTLLLTPSFWPAPAEDTMNDGLL